MMNAVEELSPDVKAKVLGVVLFGNTENGQTKSSIPGYPGHRLLAVCRTDDGVCGVALVVTAGHFDYVMDGFSAKATNFLISKIDGTN
jgi:cutinase